MKKKQEPLDLPEMEPASTANGRESQLASLAYDAVEQRIRNGTASAMELVYFLKLGSQQQRLEKEKLEAEIETLKAKTKVLNESKERDKLYADAIAAMKFTQVQED